MTGYVPKPSQGARHESKSPRRQNARRRGRRPPGLTGAAVGGLLCLPDQVSGPLLEQVRAGGVDGIGHEEAVALVSRPAGLAA